MKSKLLLIITAIILLSFPKVNFGQTPNLGAASSFALFTSVGAFTNLGPSLVTGDIGTNAGPLTGFPPGTVIGQTHVEDAVSLQASTDLSLAYTFLVNLPCGPVLGTTLGNGQVLTPNVYCLGAAATINGDLTLDGEGDPNAVFIFKIDGALATSTFSNVFLINGASIQNVFWQVNGAFTLGDYSSFRGNILANGAIELLEGSSLFGRGLSIAGAIHLHNNIVNIGLAPVASVITASGPTTFCIGGSVILSGNVGGVWSTGETTPSITVTTSGDYFVTNTNSFGSVISNHIIVTVNPLPLAIAGANRSIILNTSTQIGAPAVPGSTYSWSSVPPGFTSNLADPIVTPLVTTTYTVIETITATGCQNSNSVIVSVTAIDAADMAITKISLTTPNTAGQPIRYSLTVQNNGPSTALGVMINDNVPAQILLPQYSLSLSGPWSPWTGSYAVGTVLSGSSMTIYIEGTLGVSVTGNITNTGTVNSTTPDPDLTNNTSTSIVAVSDLADMAITKICLTTPITPGQPIRYSLTVQNNGPSTALGVMIDDNVPSQILLPQYSLSLSGPWSPWTGSYAVGTMLSGGSIAIYIEGTLSNSAIGNITNTGTVNSTTPDPILTNNTSTVISLVASSADMAITKICLTTPVTAGLPIRYSLTVQNNGPSTALGVMIDDNIPSHILLPQYSLSLAGPWLPWTGSYAVGTVLSGGSMTIYIEGTLSNSATGNITNTGTVNSTTPDPILTNNTSTVISTAASSADLAIVKTSLTTPVTAGLPIRYSLTIQNNGPSTALGVMIDDNIPAQILLPQYSLSLAGPWLPWTGSYAVGTVLSGGSMTIYIEGTLGASVTGNITNTGTVNSTTPDPILTNNTSTVISLVASSAELAIVKTSLTTPVTAGLPIRYSLTVQNNGPSTALGVMINDNLPSQILLPQYALTLAGPWSPWTGSYAVGTVLSGGSMTIYIEGTLEESVTGNITNTGTVNSTTPDPILANNTSTVTSLVASSADMAIIKTCLTTPVTAGLPIRYSLTVQNNGPSTALGVMINDNVPSQILLPQYALTLAGPWSPWTGSYAVGTMLSGGSMTIYIEGTLGASVTGIITNTGTVNSTTPDPILTNNTSTVISLVNTSADMAIIKTSLTTPVTAGLPIRYSLTVQNNGPSTALGVMINDNIPAQILLPQYSLSLAGPWLPWTGSYAVGTVLSGGSMTIYIEGTLGASVTGNITNTGTVNSTTPDPILTNNTSTVISLVNTSADMAIIKTCLTTPVTAGLPIQYALTIQNNGPSTALGVMINDNIPAQILLPQYALTLAGPWLPWTGSYVVGTVLNGGSMTIYIQGTLISGATGIITNVATVSSTTPDPFPANNTSTNTVALITVADMSITKICTTLPLTIGEQIVYTLSVVNLGPSDAQNVIIADAIPVSISNAEYSLNGGTTWLAWTGSYNAGPVAALQSFTLLIRGTIVTNLTGSITNTATVSSSTNDPNLANNTSTAVILINRPPVTFNEHVYTCKDVTIVGNVLINGDYDPDATALTVNTVPVVNTAHGSFTVLSNGDFTYIPVAGYIGSDTAVVAVCDNGIPLPSQCTNDTVFLNVVIAVTADAGPDQLLCAHYTSFLTGNFPPSGSVGNWTFVSGPVVVTPSPPNTPAATVSGLIPGVMPYVFRYTISTTFPGGTTCMSEDTMTILNYYYPSLPFAGPDQYLYLSSGTSMATTMQANLPGFGLGNWVQQSGPSVALIADLHDPFTTISNLVPGTYAFLWIIGNGICDPNQDEVFVTVKASATASAGADMTICEGSTAYLSGSQATNYTGLLWATTGSGYFSNTSLLHPVYTPGASDITGGSVKLYLTAYNTAPYQSAVDTMLLTITRQAVISAGTGASTCQGSPVTITGATAMYATSLLWTAPGPGVLTGETTLTPTYTPSAGQTGIVMLTLTASSAAPCVEVTSQAVLTIHASPVSDAGPDQAIAYGTSTRLSGKGTGGSGSYAFEWQPATLLLGYTTENPQTVILTEAVTFSLSVTDMATGCKSTDHMEITFSSHNLPPVAINDYDTTGVIVPITINILSNDYDPDGWITSVTLCGGPYHGLATLNSDSTITYTPKAGFSGLDSLCYFICDNGYPVLCDTATVYIWVSWDSPVNWLVIYNVITPNADGNNDRWVIDGIEKFPNNSVVIFNRWGDKINGYERYDNTSVVWDGTNLKGDLVPDGTYYYILSIKDGGNRNGWIFVRRGTK